jgi:hypothetical protein
MKQKKTVETTAAHLEVAESRRRLLVQIFNQVQDFQTICYIGGHIKREIPWKGRTTIYINPPMTAKDKTNNDEIKRVIRENAYGESNIHLFECTINDVHRKTWNNIRKGRVLFVGINTDYYFGSEILELAQHYDKIAVASHVA